MEFAELITISRIDNVRSVFLEKQFRIFYYIDRKYVISTNTFFNDFININKI